jgi:hypothetical protein
VRFSFEMRRLLRPLWLFLAAVFLVEAWLWSHLAPAVAWIVARLRLPALKRRIAASIERLPPAATVAVFLLPMSLVLPLKLAGVWLLSRGVWLGALAVLIVAKVVSVGLTAFIFQVTRPKLLQLAWFRWIYERVMTGLAWAHRQIDPWKVRLATQVRRLRRLLGGRGRFLRRLIRLRRRAQRV